MIHVNRSKIDQEKAMLWGKRELFFVRRLKKSDFPIPILTSYIRSVIAPKRISRYWFAWCQSLAFFKLYKIHVKKLKIDQETTKLWGFIKSFHFMCNALYNSGLKCCVCLLYLASGLRKSIAFEYLEANKNNYFQRGIRLAICKMVKNERSWTT